MKEDVFKTRETTSRSFFAGNVAIDEDNFVFRTVYGKMKKENHFSCVGVVFSGIGPEGKTLDVSHFVPDCFQKLRQNP